MGANEYMPSDDEVRESYVHGETCDSEGGVWGAEVPGAQESFTRWLAAHDARVKRDAAREALDGLINERRTAHDEAATSNRVGGMVLELHAQQVATNYRDAHYPEETP